MDSPVFSVVIPAFNEAKMIRESLEVISSYLRGVALPYEVIVVDDGSTDDTRAVAEQFASEVDASVRVVQLEKNEGKGSAVRRGVAEARGEVISFIDADLPYRVQNLGDALALVQSGATDIAIGGRDLRGSDADPSYPFLRRLMGKTFSFVIRAFLVRRIPDTQCGLKAFSRNAAKILFSESKLNGFGFDFEVLFLANKYGFRIERLPVAMSHRHESKVRLVRDSLGMLLDVFRVRRYDRQLAYRAPRRCPVCFSSEVWSLTQIGAYVIRECCRCKSRYLNVFPSDEELAELYNGDYFESSDSRRYGYEKRDLDRGVARTAQKRAQLLKRFLSAQARVLEVGAGTGQLGSLLVQDFDYVGIDLSDGAAREARSNGVPVYRASLSDFVNTGSPFDAVTLFHVFEHLTDPHDALGKINELLKPGGVLILVTPDTESLLCALSGDRWVSYKLPEHLILYSRSALIELLERSGFEIVAASADFEYCTREFLVSRLEQLSGLVAGFARPFLKITPDPLPVSSGSIRIVARRRSGGPANMRTIRAAEATHAR